MYTMDQLRSFLAERLVGKVQEVYIQQPANMQMVYPCVLISREPGDTKFADNLPYRHTRRYRLTAIDEEPNSLLYSLLVSLPMCVHNRSYPADNLNHDVFTISFEEEEV